MCGYCGKPISAETGTARNGEVKRYYKCNGKKYDNACHKANVRQDILEPLILDGIKKQLTDKKIMDELIKQLLHLQDVKIAENCMLNVLISEKKKVDNSLNNLVSAIEQGIISNTTGKRLRELEEQQSNLEKQILIERNKIAIKMSESDIREFYESAIDLAPQTLINYLVKEVILYDDKVIVKFNNPLRTSPDNSQGFSFYHKKVYRTINEKSIEMDMEYAV